MQILSFIHDSFQEFEPYQSLVLFCNRCNMSCRYCYNLKHIQEDNVKYDAKVILDTKINPMHDAVVFLGGEPTLHNDLLQLLKYVVDIKNLKTKVFTNGQLPDVIETCIRYINSISIDFKCVNNVDILGINIDSKTYLSNIHKTINICKKNDIDLELRTTIYTTMDSYEREAIENYRLCNFADIRHIYQNEFQISK